MKEQLNDDRAVSTGSGSDRVQSTPQSSLRGSNPVATAPGTDLGSYLAISSDHKPIASIKQGLANSDCKTKFRQMPKKQPRAKALQACV
jgi:hypothetical protein